MPNDELSNDQLDELRSAVLATTAPPELEDDVIRALKEAGVIRERVPRWPAFLGAAALGIVAFLAGYFVSLRAPIPPIPDESMDTYVLLLREEGSSSPESPELVEQQVSEYTEWAHAVARTGNLVSGEKLAGDGRVLASVGDRIERTEWTPGGTYIGGFFLIRARTYEEAAEIAGTCPHLAYGGAIEIRRIDPT